MRRVVYMVAAFAFLTSQAHAAPAELAMTEERNAAVGFAATQQLVVMESIINQCRTFNGVGDQADNAYQAWNARNSLASRAAWTYLTLAGDVLTARQGAEAGKKFYADRKAEFGAAAKQSLLAIFKDGIVDIPACQRLVAEINRGAMDVSAMPEHFKMLQEIDAEILEMQPE